MKTLAALSLVGAVGLASVSAFAQDAVPTQQPPTIDIRVAEDTAPQAPVVQPPEVQPPVVQPPVVQQPVVQQPAYGADPNAYGYAQPGGYGYVQQPGAYGAQPIDCRDATTGESIDPSECAQAMQQAAPAQDPYATSAGYSDGYDPQAYTQFESALAPYGSWMDVAPYGRVWVPSNAVVGSDFAPYATGGHWVLTEYGWTWVSDYDWGWAPFHYGRWVSANNVGWCWVPGTTWGPAWVSWRSGGDYVGWAPLPPVGVPLPAATVWGSPWRFTNVAQLGAARPLYLPRTAYPAAWGATAVVANTRTVNVNGVAVPVNAGPVQLAPRAGVPISPLGRVAPLAGPRATIVPRMGSPLATRPWIGARGYGGFAGGVAPRPVWNQPMATQPRPAWNAPAMAPRPAWGAPAQMPARPAWGGAVAPRPYWSQPSAGYAAPRPAWGAPAARPMWSAPAARPAWSAPAARPTWSAPAYHPSFGGGGGWHGGGGFGGGAHFGGFGGGAHFGGGFRRR